MATVSRRLKILFELVSVNVPSWSHEQLDSIIRLMGRNEIEKEDGNWN